MRTTIKANSVVLLLFMVQQSIVFLVKGTEMNIDYYTVDDNKNTVIAFIDGIMWQSLENTSITVTI